MTDPLIQRVTFLVADKTPFEVHNVPLGKDPETYAREWNERSERNGQPARPYVVNREIGTPVPRQTADEAKKANFAAMGETLGATYSALWQSLAITYHYWNEYIVLFGTKPERIALLNQAAPSFFRMLQDELWENSLMQLVRFTDPEKSPGKGDRTNLSIRTLPGLITDAKLKDTVDALVAEALKQTEFAKDWRDRHIGHRDLKLALDQPTKPLAEGSRKQVKEALNAIADVLNAIQSYYLKSQTRFDLGGRIGGAISLLHLIDGGLRAQELQQKRLEEGKPMEEALVSRDL
jgi:hypothetical protein